uniref:nucleotidyltransferase family protein n=2 Tax=Pseudomonadota TaxID=1224 RepID=UPI0013D5E942
VHPAQAAIDLHWDFTGVHLPFPLTPAEIWDSLETIKVGQRDVPAITGADLALLLAGHGTKERWRSLGWV